MFNMKQLQLRNIFGRPVLPKEEPDPHAITFNRIQVPAQGINNVTVTFAHNKFDDIQGPVNSLRIVGSGASACYAGRFHTGSVVPTIECEQAIHVPENIELEKNKWYEWNIFDNVLTIIDIT